MVCVFQNEVNSLSCCSFSLLVLIHQLLTHAPTVQHACFSDAINPLSKPAVRCVSPLLFCHNSYLPTSMETVCDLLGTTALGSY